MNIRKNIDYTTMFAAIDAVINARKPQMELYCELGRLVSNRPEKGAAVAVAEYLAGRHPDATGFSPRNLRRMRDFYRMYEETPELLKLAMEIGWTQNVVILEAELSTKERRWYLQVVKHFNWSKAELLRAIASEVHLELTLDESEVLCYTENEQNEMERTEHDQDTLPLSWEYLQKPDGRVCNERYGEESGTGAGVSDRIRSHQHRGDRQSGLSACPPQIGRAWHRMLRQKSTPASEQRLRGVRSADRYGPDQPPEYVPDLWRRLCRQDAPPDGLYRPPQRGCRPVVHRRFRCDLAGCGGRLPGATNRTNTAGLIRLHLYGGPVMKKVLPYLSNEIKGAKLKGMWGHSDIPIFSVGTIHEFNQLVGYVKYKNAANGTVLYRGQPKDYLALKPSGGRGNGCVSNKLISKIAEDKHLQHYLGLDNSEIIGWEKYQEIMISAVLQHYGANTNCMDFVDNHWCALWFGLYRFDSRTQSYIKRKDNDSSLYIYLYLADTNCSSIHGTYIGEDTYTVDLRKALPSYFLRPASQHGWVVCWKDAEKCKDYAENVLCVIEVKVGDANSWIGSGLLLTPENFFPDFSTDDGYKVLLTRQERSGVFKLGSKPILPVGTIQNYHYHKSFYSSDGRVSDVIPQKEYYADEKKIDSITTLYEILLQKGWTEETCFDAEWNQLNPCIGQSPATALVVQEIFGGTVVRYSWKKRVHYFNRIAGQDYDLTSQERFDHPFDNYAECNDIGISKKSRSKIEEKARILKQNSGISEKEMR